MKISRRNRLATVFVTIFSVLFMQLAVAAYSCPGLMPGEAGALFATSQTMSPDAGEMAGMPGCAEMDMEQPNLCHAYTQAGNQALDKPQLPQVQPWMLAGAGLALQTVQTFPHVADRIVDAPLLARTTAPPLSIRNCCFRF